MFSELNWLGAVLLGLGVLVIGALTWWVIVQAVHRRDNLDPETRRQNELTQDEIDRVNRRLDTDGFG